MKAHSVGVFGVLTVAAAIGLTQLAARGGSGREDCARYNPDNVRLTDMGERGWRISRDDGAIFMVLDTKEDADVMMGVFKSHTSFCYVGRDNKRVDRDRYVQHYWK